MQQQLGQIIFYLPQKGTGYLRLADTHEEFFFRRKDLATAPWLPVKGEWVRFSIRKERRGYFAVAIRPATVA